MASGAGESQSDVRSTLPAAKENSMNSNPMIVHAAADLHRNALLREAADDRRTTPTRVRTNSAGPGKVCRRVFAQVAAVVSRVIDDFEPGPGPRSPETARLGSRTQS
jgi:hypothetical protein